MEQKETRSFGKDNVLEEHEKCGSRNEELEGNADEGEGPESDFSVEQVVYTLYRPKPPPFFGKIQALERVGQYRTRNYPGDRECLRDIRGRTHEEENC